MEFDLILPENHIMNAAFIGAKSDNEYQATCYKRGGIIAKVGPNTQLLCVSKEAIAKHQIIIPPN